MNEDSARIAEEDVYCADASTAQASVYHFVCHKRTSLLHRNHSVWVSKLWRNKLGAIWRQLVHDFNTFWENSVPSLAEFACSNEELWRESLVDCLHWHPHVLGQTWWESLPSNGIVGCRLEVLFYFDICIWFGLSCFTESLCHLGSGKCCLAQAGFWAVHSACHELGGGLLMCWGFECRVRQGLFCFNLRVQQGFMQFQVSDFFCNHFHILQRHRPVEPPRWIPVFSV